MKKQNEIQKAITANAVNYPIHILEMEVNSMSELSETIPHMKIIEVADLQTLTLFVIPSPKPISKILLLENNR